MLRPDKELLHAMAFAFDAHRRQKRKGTSIPYIFHPFNVGRMLMIWGHQGEVPIAGILHDTVEDTEVSQEELFEEFGLVVGRLVEELTDPEKARRWEIRKQGALDRLEGMSSGALWIVCADKLDNLRSIQDSLLLHGETLWGRFNRPKADQSWYYLELVRRLRRLMPQGLGQQVVRTLEGHVLQVFGPVKGKDPSGMFLEPYNDHSPFDQQG